MRVDYQQLYLHEVFALAKSIALKSDYCAAATNEYLSLYHSEQTPDDPRLFKAYMHLSGQYHSTDQAMQVISLDTQQVIDFTKEALKDHPATLRGYRIGSRYYKELVEKYPSQEDLIKGILYPAEIEEVVKAKDFSIVSWDQSLVEDNEENLIPELSQWCQDYAKRWFNHSFTVTHSLYTASFLMNLYQLLPLMILEIRSRNCRTDKAHSFHVRMYLASHNGLDEFLPHLSKEQAFWLYKNIKTIQRHQGSDETLNWVIENILTKRSIPLNTYRLEHDAQSLLTGRLIPEIHFKQESHNGLTQASKESFSKQYILSKIASSAPGNIEYDQLYPKAIDDAGWSQYNRLDTKVFEATTAQVGQSRIVDLMSNAMSLWALGIATDRLGVVTRYTHPVSAADVTISALDAYYVFLYAYGKVHHWDIEDIPPLYCSEAPVWPKPTLEQVQGITEAGSYDQEHLRMFHSQSLPERNFINLDQFQESIETLTDAKQNQKLISDYYETHSGKESFKAAWQALYQHQLYRRPETGQKYKTYLESKGIDLSAFDKETFKTLYESLFHSITGIEYDSAVGEDAMQKAMVEITRRLSSYSVLFIEPLSASMLKELNWDYLKIDHSGLESGDLYEVLSAPLEMDEYQEKSKMVREVPIEKLVIDWVPKSPEGPFEIPTDIRLEEVDEVPSYLVSMDGMGFESDEIPGLEDWQTPGSYRGVTNLYNSDCYPVLPVPKTQDPNDFIFHHKLPLKYDTRIQPTKLKDFQAFALPAALRYFKDEVTVVVLNAFYSNHKETTVENFKYNAGFSLLTSFAYTGHEPLRLKSFTPNLGTNFVQSLGPWTDVRKSIDIGKFTQLSDKPIDLGQAVNASLFMNVYIDHRNFQVEFALKDAINAGGFSLVNGLGKGVALQPLQGNVQRVVFAFRHIPDKIQLPRLVKIQDGDINFSLRLNTRRYLIGQFKIQNTQLDAGQFRQARDVNLALSNHTAQHEYQEQIVKKD